MYVHVRDPVTKAVPPMPKPLLLIGWAVALLVIFYSSAGQYWATTTTTAECSPDGDDYSCQALPVSQRVAPAPTPQWALSMQGRSENRTRPA